MRRFLICLKLDVSEGMRVIWSRLALAIPLALLSYASLRIIAASNPSYDGFIPTSGESILTLIAGMQAYVPRDGQLFTPPITWLLLLMLMEYVVLTYPYGNLMGYGRYELLALGSRWSWWLSKCAWCCLAALAFVVLSCGTAFVVPLVLGSPISFDVTPASFDILNFDLASIPTGPYNFTPIILEFLTVSMGISLLELLASLVFRPIWAYVAMAALLMASAFLTTPLLLGNYLMAARSSTFVLGGLEPLVGIVIGCALTVVATVIGGLIFSRMDILNKEFE